MINAAATFLTLGHLQSATIVNRLPHIPTIIIRIVITAANVRSGRANLQEKKIVFFIPKNRIGLRIV